MALLTEEDVRNIGQLFMGQHSGSSNAGHAGRGRGN